MKINWRVRIKNKVFWLTIIPLALLLINQVLALFGVNFDQTIITEKLVQIVGTIFAILGLIGVVNDPTTAGVEDSDRAMEYTKPQ